MSHNQVLTSSCVIFMTEAEGENGEVVLADDVIVAVSSAIGPSTSSARR